MEATRLQDDVVKVIAGAILALGSVLGMITAFLAVVDLSLTRKILLAFIVLIVWMIVEFFAWKSSRGGEKRKTTWSLLLDLIVLLRNELNPETKKFFRKELFIRITRWALMGLLVVILLAALFSFAEDSLALVIDPPTRTPTPTQTFTVTPSLTSTLTASPPPDSLSHYYMIVLDASVNMQEAFDGQTKWGAALVSLDSIFRGLNPKSKYGLVVIGGSSTTGNSDSCADPSTPVIPLISEMGGDLPVEKVHLNNLIAQVNQLQPIGGGSIYQAFVLAKRQLEDLPRDTVKSMIFITGSSDTCTGQEEWVELEKILQLTTLDHFLNEIIVLDETGLMSEDIFVRINQSAHTNLQVSSSNQQLQQVTGSIINQVNTHVEVEQAVIEGTTPPIAPTSGMVASQIPSSVSILPTSAPPTAIPATQIPPTQVPPTPIPTEIPWDPQCPNVAYGALRVSGSGIHYQVREKSSNRVMLQTEAQFGDPNDVKTCAFSGDGRFAAAYHYESDSGGYTWIGIWNIASGAKVGEVTKEGFTLDMSGVFN